jgi:N-acetylglutamate synthase-like GNAT family acetyltransferase
MQVNIRLATLEDIPNLQKLIPESVRVLSAPYYTARQIESALVYIFGVDSQLIKDGTYFAAEHEQEIVGCGGWSKRATLFGGDQWKSDEPEPLLDPAKDPARIRAFYIHPNWARKGIGRQIIIACENAARDAGFKTIELAATLPGEPLYSAMGYNRQEQIELKTPDGESLPAFRMSKDIAARGC